MKKLLCLCLIVFCLVGCSNSADNGIVSYMEAKEKIINEGAILVDVRTKEEYDTNHIAGASLLTLDSISEESASKVIDSKNSVVIVYCKSGNRSSQALTILKNLGYTEVYDLGAITNWKE